MDLTLDQLLNSMNVQALEKSAEESGDDKKDDKDDGKNMPPWLKDKKDGKDDKKDDDKKDDDKKDDDKDKGQEKSASDAGAALAREVMAKALSTKLETPEMNKQAQTAGQALAAGLLENLRKTASAGDLTVVDGGAAPGTVPTKVQEDTAQQTAEAASQTKPMPTGDGLRNAGTINEIFDAIIQDAVNQGAASVDQVEETPVTPKEGLVEDHAVPNQVKEASAHEDEIEKAAAITELVNQGVDFEDAVALVKQAAEEIEYEIEKVAAMNQLMAEGVDFEQAIELVKQASAGDMTVMDGGPAPGTAATKVQADTAQQTAEAASQTKPMPTGDGVQNHGTINQIFDAIIQDAVNQGAASVDQVEETPVTSEEGAVEAHAVPNQVKTAAMNKLLEAGVDFDEAVNFVKQAGAQAVLEAGARKLGTGLSRVAGFAKATGKAMVPTTPLAKKIAIGAGVAGSAAIGGAIAHKMGTDQEKKAAFDALIDAGVNFEQAALLVARKSQELYGE